MASPVSIVRRRLREIDGAMEGASGFGEGDAVWVGGKEIAHWEGERVVDIRLTRQLIRERRAELRSDPRVQLRTSSSADWLEVEMGSPADVAFVMELLTAAAAAHRERSGTVVGPPSDAEIAKRRRFH